MSPHGGNGPRFATIIGAGPGGIATAIGLRKAGIEDFQILERASSIGGTWANNRYPGLSCDVPSLVYCFSFDRKVDWTRTHADHVEIQAYLQDVADRYGITAHVRLGVEVTGAEWDDAAGAWTVRTADGATSTSTVLVSAVGMFNRLRRPDLPGLGGFAGTLVHSGEWPEDGIDLAGRRVGVIGSAASAVQMVPELAGKAAALHVFQRTANWIFPKDDTAHSAETLAGFRSDPAALDGPREEILTFFERLVTYDDPELIEGLRRSAQENLAQIHDPQLRSRLEPTLPIGAQRPLFSSTFYPTFNSEHVELVTDPISHVTARGVVTTDGRERPVDVLVTATGYDATRFLSVIDVTGTQGRRLGDEWAEGAFAYKGITVPGFPNLFMLYGPNTNNGSIISMLELQADYILGKIGQLHAGGVRTVEVRPEAARRYNDDLQATLATVTPLQTTGSRYYRAGSGRIVTQWPGTMAAFAEVLARPDDDAYLMTGPTGPTAATGADGSGRRPEPIQA